MEFLLNGAVMAFRRKTLTGLPRNQTPFGDVSMPDVSATDNILAPEYFKELLPRLAEMDVVLICLQVKHI